MAGSTVEIISPSIRQNNPTAIWETFELDFTSAIGICGYVYSHKFFSSIKWKMQLDDLYDIAGIYGIQ